MIYATEQQVVVTSSIVVIVALVSFLLGMWWGRRRGLEQADEEIRWQREEAAARAALRFQPSPEMAHEAWLAHEEQALRLANVARELSPSDQPLDSLPGHLDKTVLMPTAVISPEEISTTAWTRQMAADMDRFIRDLIGGTDEQLREITR